MAVHQGRAKLSMKAHRYIVHGLWRMGIVPDRKNESSQLLVIGDPDVESWAQNSFEPFLFPAFPEAFT